VSTGARWTTVEVHTSLPAEVSAALFAAGALGVQELRGVLITHFPDDGAAVEAALAAVRGADEDAQITTAPLAPVAWDREWRRGLTRHALGPLVVCPPWLADGEDPARTIVIAPEMAFGTGEHPTTRGVVRLLPRAIRAGDRVADLGCGSAVLAIAAAKLGAGRVVGIEVDAEAIPNAEANVARNGVRDRVTVIEGDAGVILPLVAPVRVVVANIISSVLTELLPAIDAVLPADGDLLCAGVLATEREDFVAVLAVHGFAPVAEDAEDVWWSVHARRTLS
jgi:ribosomal protein L11 methyltransferase